MTTRPTGLYRALTDIHARPAPFETYTAPLLWDDDHISAQMLAFHLDPDSEPASRPHDFVARSADWIIDRFGLAAGRRVADFGCGPGLYANRFAAAGAEVTGVDLSRRSLAHARAEAEARGLDVDYVRANYLDFDTDRGFDLITLIYCDLCPLSPAQRRTLLTLFRDRLADGGSILLDVVTRRAFDGRDEGATHAHRLMDGFWSPGDYWGFLDTFKYEAEGVVLDKYTIVEPHRTWRVFNWLQYFTDQALAAEFAACGLEIVERYEDVTGAPFEGGDVMAVVARKA